MTMFTFVALFVVPFAGLVAVTDGAESVVNWKEKSGPGLSGGSFVSVSVTSAERIVTVHTSPSAKSVSGSIVIDVPGLPVMTLECEPELAHEMPAAVMVTLSVQLMTMFVFVALPVVESTGDVETICGFASVVNEKL